MKQPVVQIERLGKRYRLGRTWAGANGPWARILRGVRRRAHREGGAHDDAGPDPRDPRRRPRGVDYLWALRDASFDLYEGDCLGIIGRNGSGKSTLLKVLSRITAPTEGRVMIRGRVASLLEVGTGFHPELTGRDNIFLNGSILGMRAREIRRRFDEIVDFAGVERFLDTPVKRYSSGMYVRLAFAVAAHLEPEILLVDEVLAVGDLSFQRKCLGKMQSIAGSGRTVVFVSHNLGAINAFCTRAVRLDGGRVADHGSPADVVAGYIGANFSGSRSRSFARDASKPMQIRAVELIGDDALLSRESPLDLRVAYDVKERLAGAELLVTLETADGTTVCELRDVDGAPDLALRRESGYYTAHVRIPGGLLNTGTYVLRAAVQRSGYEFLDQRDGLVFDLHEPEGQWTARAGGSARPGVLHLVLPWRTRRTDSEQVVRHGPVAVQR
ncbi:MAG: ATP-binding cassette domain-containing protein [Planctomycetota bacterium]|nr:MAG: ATP-binding cassette domain-containing protein [Planctomycetota bacterium]